jgi:hypothetical protein
MPDRRMIREDFRKGRANYERLLRLGYEGANRRARASVAEQVVQAEVERCEIYRSAKNALEECLAQIDQSILGCRNHVNTYRETCSDLVMLNQRLAKLGADPLPFPEQIPAANFEDLIRARVEGLAAEGKI